MNILISPGKMRDAICCTVIFLLFNSSVSQVLGADSCLWYGDAKENTLFSPIAGTPPKRLDNSTAIKIVADICPELYGASGPKKENQFCCDPAALSTLSDSLKEIRKAVGECPSCYKNIRNLFCLVTCDRNRGKYFAIDEQNGQAAVKLNYTAQFDRQEIRAGVIDYDSFTMNITKLSFFMHSDFASKLFDSCSRVKNPISHLRAINNWCISCDPHSFMKNLLKELSPTLAYITPKFIDGEEAPAKITPFNIKTLAYNEGPTNTTGGCSFPYDTLTLLEDSTFIDSMAITIIVIFCIVLLTFASFILYDRTGESDYSREKSINRRKGSTMEKLAVSSEKAIVRYFTKWGTLCSKEAWKMLLVGMLVVSCMSIGLLFLKIEVDPVRIWSNPESRTGQEKAHFDENFSPYYRMSQVILNAEGLLPFKVTMNDGQRKTFGPVFQQKFMNEALRLQTAIEDLIAGDAFGTKLDDICYKPMLPENDNCMTQSAFSWFEDDKSNRNYIMSMLNYPTPSFHRTHVSLLHHATKCSRNPAEYNPILRLSCLAPYGRPVISDLVLGGFPNEKEIMNATALIITFYNKNSAEKNELGAVEAWEQAFLDFMKEYSYQKPEYVSVAYKAERSIQDELSSPQQDQKMGAIAIPFSIVIMLLYVSMALAKIGTWSSLLVDSKFTLATGAFCKILLTISATMGFYGFFGVPINWLVIQVITCLVFFISWDNVFILVQTCQQNPRRENESHHYHIGRAVGAVAPIMISSVAAEAVCFFIVGMSGIPWVQAMAFCAGLAVIIDFFMQITCFVALVSLDSQRREKNLFDVCCFAGGDSFVAGSRNQIETTLQTFFEKYYIPMILSKWVRISVIVFFLVTFSVSIAFAPRASIAFEPELSVADDSYLANYYKMKNEFLSTGPPLFFVVRENNLNYTDPFTLQKFCTGHGCSHNSLPSLILRAAEEKQRTYISSSVASWVDDYMGWLRNPNCCKLNAQGNVCSSKNSKAECRKECPKGFVDSNQFWPNSVTFNKYLPNFLNNNPTKTCQEGGHASFEKALVYSDREQNLTLGATHFMTYHTALKSYGDYYISMNIARELAFKMSSMLSTPTRKVDVYAHSAHYVYLEQYMTMWSDTLKTLGLSITAVFAVTFFTFGFDLGSALIVLITLTMMMTHTLFLMYLWQISLTPISLANLVLAVGISVGFCIYMLRAFTMSVKTDRLSRAKESFNKTASCVFSGVMMTNLYPMIALAFATAPVYQIFYFRLYVLIILVGVAHGLILLPVLLSFFGPALNSKRVHEIYRQQTTNIKSLKGLMAKETLAINTIQPTDGGNHLY